VVRINTVHGGVKQLKNLKRAVRNYGGVREQSIQGGSTYKIKEVVEIFSQGISFHCLYTGP
jgi:hypothetical protein